MTKSNYDEAQRMVSDPRAGINQAQVYATLALVDEMRAAREPAPELPDIVYGLISKKRDVPEATWHTVSLYVDHEEAKEELRLMQASPDQGHEWSIQPYALHN